MSGVHDHHQHVHVSVGRSRKKVRFQSVSLGDMSTDRVNNPFLWPEMSETCIDGARFIRCHLLDFHYREYDHYNDDHAESNANTTCANVGSSNEIFGFEDIISWQPHGRCFLIHKKPEFVRNIMPRFFHQSKLTSFQRQLNLYGFVRLTTGADKGGYYHKLFLRGRPELCHKIHRQKIKGHGCKMVPLPGYEPNFFYTVEVFHDAVTPSDADSKRFSNEQDNQVRAAIYTKDSKGSEISAEVSPTKDKPTHDAVWLQFDGDHDITLVHDEDVNDMDNVSVELMAIGNDEIRDNQKDKPLLDPDDQIEKESLAQVACDFAMNEATMQTTRTDSITEPVIVAPHTSSHHQHGPYSELAIPDGGSRRWNRSQRLSIPAIKNYPSSHWKVFSDVEPLHLKPFDAQSSATAPSMWSYIDRHYILQQPNNGMGRGSGYHNTDFNAQCIPTRGTVLAEVTHHSEQRDVEEVWFDEGHRFFSVTPTKSGPQPPWHVSTAAAWVGSSAAEATSSRDTTVLVLQSGDGGNSCSGLTTTTVDGSTCTASYHPSLLPSTAGRRGSVPRDRRPPPSLLSWPSSKAGRQIFQPALSPLSQTDMIQRMTARGRVVDAIPYSTNTVDSGQQQSQQQLARQPFWDGRHWLS